LENLLKVKENEYDEIIDINKKLKQKIIELENLLVDKNNNNIKELDEITDINKKPKQKIID
jgi:hypothetical protein